MPAPGTTRPALAGVAATAAGLGVSHAVAGVSSPAASPALAVGEKAIALSPAPLKDWAIVTFGAADKLVLVVGIVAVTLALGALIGLVARRSLPAGLAAGAALAAVALAAAYDPGAGWWWLPGLVALGVGAWALTSLLKGAASGVGVGDRPGTRRALLRLAGVGGLGVLGWLAGEGLGRRGVRLPGVPPPTLPPLPPLPPRSATPFPAGIEGELPGVSPFVTRTSEFFRVDTLLIPPIVDPTAWRLRIDGLVERPYEIGLAELTGLDVIERAVTLACVSNPVGGEYVGSARWLGVRTSELLARAGVRPGADQVLSTSVDGFTVSTPLPALLDDRDAIVAFGMNGEPLPIAHGYPARLLTPGLYGFVGATKWLVRMTVTTYAAAEAYWTGQGWSIDAPVKPSARIEVPRGGTRAAAGPVRVGGTAWAHGAGVGGVQVRVDGGPWQDATLGPDGGVQYWRQLLWTWDAAPGDHALQARVVDARGVPQGERAAMPFPDGAAGLHTVRVRVG